MVREQAHLLFWRLFLGCSALFQACLKRPSQEITKSHSLSQTKSCRNLLRMLLGLLLYCCILIISLYGWEGWQIHGTQQPLAASGGRNSAAPSPSTWRVLLPLVLLIPLAYPAKATSDLWPSDGPRGHSAGRSAGPLTYLDLSGLGHFMVQPTSDGLQPRSWTLRRSICFIFSPCSMTLDSRCSLAAPRSTASNVRSSMLFVVTRKARKPFDSSSIALKDSLVVNSQQQPTVCFRPVSVSKDEVRNVLPAQTAETTWQTTRSVCNWRCERDNSGTERGMPTCDTQPRKGIESLHFTNHWCTLITADCTLRIAHTRPGVFRLVATVSVPIVWVTSWLAATAWAPAGMLLPCVFCIFCLLMSSTDFLRV